MAKPYPGDDTYELTDWDELEIRRGAAYELAYEIWKEEQ